jgi:hypothetical protein
MYFHCTVPYVLENKLFVFSSRMGLCVLIVVVPWLGSFLAIDNVTCKDK